MTVPKPTLSRTAVINSFETLGRAVQAMETRLRTDMSEMRKDIAELRNDVTEIRGDVAELRSDVTEIRGDVAELRGDVTELRGNVAELRRDNVEIRGEISELRAEIALRPTIEQMNEAITVSQMAIMSQFAQYFGRLERRMDERFDTLDRRLSVLEQRPPTQDGATGG